MAESLVDHWKLALLQETEQRVLDACGRWERVGKRHDNLARTHAWNDVIVSLQNLQLVKQLFS